MKLKVIKDDKGGKSVMVIACQSGMSHSTAAVIWKNKNKVTEAVTGSASLKAMKPTKIQEGPVSDMEKFLMTWVEDQTQNRIFLNTMTIIAKGESLLAMLKEKAYLTMILNLLLVLDGFNKLRIVAYYIM